MKKTSNLITFEFIFGQTTNFFTFALFHLFGEIWYMSKKWKNAKVEKFGRLTKNKFKNDKI